MIGAEYASIYNEDGSYADKNVMAVMLSYQNQFVQEQGNLFYDVKLNKKDTQTGGLYTESSGDLDTYNINIISKKTEVNSQIKSVDNRGTYSADYRFVTSG